MSPTATVSDPSDFRVPAYRFVEVTPNEGDPDAFRARLIGSLAAPWHDAGEDDGDGADWLWFKLARDAADGLPAATALLHRTGPVGGPPGATIRLTAMAPRTGLDDFERDTCNALVEDFHRRVVQPLASDGTVTAYLSEPYRPLEDWVGEDASEELSRFLAAGTASAGLSHPADATRWYRFLNAALPARREGFAEAVGEVLSRHGLAPATVEALVIAAEQIEHYERVARERRRQRAAAA